MMVLRDKAMERMNTGTNGLVSKEISIMSVAPDAHVGAGLMVTKLLRQFVSD